MPLRFSFATIVAGLLASAALAPLSPAAAQVIPGITPTPTPTPAPRSAPTRIVPPISYSLPAGPGSAPAPRQEVPAPQPSPPPVAVRTVPAPTQNAPVRQAQPAREVAPPADQVSQPQPSLPGTDPVATPAPDPVTIAPTEPAPTAAPPQPAGGESSGWPWLVGIALALMAAGGIAFARRRSQVEPEPIEEEAVAEPPTPVAPPVAAMPSPRPDQAPQRLPATPAPQPTFLSIAAKSLPSPIQIDLIPHRAGMTILEGVVDFSLVIANRGTERAENMLVSAFLRTAHAEQDEEVAGLLAAPLDPRTHNPFVLAPGEARRLDAGLTIPKAMIHAVQAGDTRVFVPLLVVAVRYRSGLTTGKRASAAFMVGRQRLGSERLGPLPYDGEPRMFEGLAARLHVPVAALRMAG